MTRAETDFADMRDRAAECFANHRLHVSKHADVSTYTLCETSPKHWTQSVQIVDVGHRYFMHGDFSQANGMSVVGYNSDTYFEPDHGNDYVWSKFMAIGGVNPTRHMVKRDHDRNQATAKAFFYAIRDRFLALMKEAP